MSELVIAEKSEIVAIADQLRALVSKTEDMSLGEMAAEVSNANVNKTDILSALTEKGVDATGAGLADIAALVAGIESGGAKVVEGEYTPATLTTVGTDGVTIEHGLGVKPDVVVFTYPLGLGAGLNTVLMAVYYKSKSCSCSVHTTSSSTSYYARIKNIDVDETTFTVPGYNSNAKMTASSYKWFAARLE